MKKLFLTCASWILSLALLFADASVTFASPPDAPREQLVEIPLHRLTAIEEELERLRERESVRDAAHAGTMQGLSLSDKSILQCAWESGVECDSCDSGSCLPTCCDGCGELRCGCGGCYSCQCPTPDAPCIDCPRVTTLRPFSNLRIYGALKTDMLINEARPLAPGTPFFLTPASTRGLDQTTFDLHARQSTLAAAFTGPVISGFQSSGVIVGLFYNDAVVVDQYGLLPLQAWGELRNEQWRIAAGLQFDVFAPGLPTVLPFSALAASGNAGNSFRGQLRVERFIIPSENRQWTIQFALSEPVNTSIDPTFRVSEDNGFPNVEGRLALGLGELQGAGPLAKRPFEIGVSGVVGQIRTTPPPPDPRVVADVWGVAVDGRMMFSPKCGLTGEFYTGKTLGSYNGGVLQNINLVTLEGIRSSGGWLEGFVFLTPCVHSHFGYAIDDPRDADVSANPLDLGRLQNSTYFANVLWDVNKTFRIGFEFTWRETDYAGLPDNEGAGYHTQIQWSF